ncbi:MAG: divergent polysaccharide deacetylase family protein [Alphaproteobacteria bacterium]
MDPIYSHGPRWERHVLRAAVALCVVFLAGLGGAALWAAQQPLQTANAAPSVKQQLRLNLPQSADAALAGEDTPVEQVEQVEQPTAPTPSSIDTPPLAEQPQSPAPVAAHQPAANPVPETDHTSAINDAQATPADNVTPADNAPVVADTSPPPPPAQHLLQLVVTDKHASVDELVLLPKGLTLVVSATNERLTDYVTFARHLGHSVLVAFPVTEEDTHPALMTPSLSDQDNLARLQALLDEHTLIDGVKLYWHNPLANREPLMLAAMDMIAERGLVLVGSNGPLMAREKTWADMVQIDLIQIGTLGETAATLPQPDYGDRDTPKHEQLATALTPDGQDELSNWVARARRAGWTISPMKKQ